MVTTEGTARLGVRYRADKQQPAAAQVARDGGQWGIARVACAGYRIYCTSCLFSASPAGYPLPAKSKLKVLAGLYSMVSDTIFLILCDAGQIRQVGFSSLNGSLGFLWSGFLRWGCLCWPGALLF